MLIAPNARGETWTPAFEDRTRYRPSPVLGSGAGTQRFLDIVDWLQVVRGKDEKQNRKQEGRFFKSECLLMFQIRDTWISKPLDEVTKIDLQWEGLVKTISLRVCLLCHSKVNPMPRNRLLSLTVC